MKKLTSLLCALFFVSLASVTTTFAEEKDSLEFSTEKLSTEEFVGNNENLIDLNNLGSVLDNNDFQAAYGNWKCAVACNLTKCAYSSVTSTATRPGTTHNPALSAAVDNLITWANAVSCTIVNPCRYACQAQ